MAPHCGILPGIQLPCATGDRPKKVLIFVTLRYWIEHATLMGMALAGLGHEVTLAYLPYPNWRKPLNRFDLRRQNAYARACSPRRSRS